MTQTSYFERPARVPRHERLNQFEEIIYNSNAPLTEKQIAKRAGLRKTPYTREILFSLLESGTIAQLVARAGNGCDMFLYTANEVTE